MSFFFDRSSNTISCEQCIKFVICYDDAIISIIRCIIVTYVQFDSNIRVLYVF
jgi:hypothetical protein